MEPERGDEKAGEKEEPSSKPPILSGSMLIFQVINSSMNGA